MAQSSGKQDPRDRYRAVEESQQRIGEAKQANLQVAYPISVDKFDSKQNTVNAQPTIKLQHVKPDGTTQWVQMPVLGDMPVFHYGGGGVSLTMPIKKGNEGLAVFASRSIDKWWHQGGVQEQLHARMNDISDGFVFPGFRSRPNWLKNVSEDSMQLRTDDGKTHFTMDPRSGGAISMVSTSNPTTMSGKAWNINVESSELKAQQNIKLDTPLTNATGDMKVNGRMDASGGFFKNGIPLGGGGGGSGGGGTVISVEAGTGLVGSGTTTEIIISLQIPVQVAHGGTGATTAAQGLLNLGGAPIASPTFTGDPKVPTPGAGDADTSIANTAWVNTYFLKLTGGTISGNLAVTGTLNITGATTLAGLTAGATSLNTLNVSGNTTLANTTAATPAPTDNSNRVATTAWIRNYVSPIAVVSTNDTSPASPTDGMMWWDSVSGQLYVYYTDANSSAWVQANTGAGFSVGSGGPFLPLSGGTLSGQLAVTFPDNGSYHFVVSGTSRAVRIRPAADYGFVEGVDTTGVTSLQPIAISGTKVAFFTSGTEVGNFDGNNFSAVGNVYGATLSSASNATIGGSLLVLSTGAPAASTVYASFSSRKIRFRQDSGDQSDAGAIDYKGYDGAALSLVGVGTAGSRKVRIFDNLSVDGTVTAVTVTATANFNAVNIYASGEIAATTALRCNGNPNAIITYTQRDNYGIAWGFYATGNSARWWNNQYGDRITLDLGGTCYFTNNTVIPNGCSYYARATDGIPYPIVGTDGANRNYIGHPSLYTNIRGVSPIIFETNVRGYGRIDADSEVKGSSIACTSYCWINGTQLSNYNGWLYTANSFRCGDFQTDGNVNLINRGTIWCGNVDSTGSLITNGVWWQNNGGWAYTPSSFRSGNTIQADNGDLNCTGVLRCGGGIYWQNSGGWMYSPWGVASGGDVQAGNDLRHAGVVRCYGGAGRGARLECQGWDWDWIGFFFEGGHMFASPDRSGAPIYYNDSWWSDERLKTNIRNSEIDALGLIEAIPVRAWEWTEEGSRLNTKYGDNRENTIGLVAQELQEKIPLAVREAPWEHKRLLLNWNYIQPYLFRAIQQLAERNTSLEERIARLEARLDQLH